MDIVKITEKENLLKAARLAQLCFHDSYEKMEKYFLGVQEHDIRGIFEGNKLIVGAASIDFEIFIRDQLFKCAGIAAVMTDPIHRRKGLVKKLMNELLFDKFKEGYPISALWPFEHSFYRKFGFESCEKPLRYKFKPSDIIDNLEADSSIKVREITDESDFPLLNLIAKNAKNKYTRIIGKYDAWKLRGDLSGFKIFIFEKNNEPIGYITFKFKKIKEWVNHMIIMDFAFKDISTKHAILRFMKNFDSDMSFIEMTIPYEEEMISYLKSYGSENQFSSWPAMVRILNVEIFFQQLVFSKKLNKSLYMKIEDPVIEENSGTWNLTISDGKCEIEKIGENTIAKESLLELSINQLTQIVTGFATVKQVLEAKKENIPQEWIEHVLFPAKATSVQLWF